MKQSKSTQGRIITLAVLSLVPLVFTALAQPFLPETVPVHYGLNGPDDWGSPSELFLVAGVCVVIGLVTTALFAVLERQRETGREDWLVFEGSSSGVSFGACVVVLALLGMAQVVYVAAAFGIAGFTLPENVVQLFVDVICGLVVLLMWGFAGYMLVTGKSLLNFRPEPTELERRTGDDKLQARAVGVLTLFLSIFVLVEWMLSR